MKDFKTLAVMFLTALPMAMSACGDDSSDAPGGGGGTAGDAGEGGSGGKGGSKGGSSGDGGTTGGSAGSGGTDQGGTGGDAGGGTGGDAGGGSGGAPPETCDLTGTDLPRSNIPTSITSDRTLTNDTVWVLNGQTKVRDGATLTIEPCTRIEGSPAPAPGVLAILRGGQINAMGTANEPILFTTTAPEGARAAGQWGGVVLLGRAPITAPTETKIYEGLTDADYTYGGTDAADSSGTMSYVRIEFAGWQIAQDKEVNGLSMAAVGSGTSLDHIMVSNIQDDCFEWWGGTVEANFLICNNPGDDMFDADEGWQGAGEHWLGRRTGVAAISSGDPNGFEWDSLNDGTTPRTNVTATNVTLCGTGATVGVEYGMVLRELITGELDNVAVLGFEYGIDTRDAFMTGDVTIDNSTFWSLANTVGAADGTDNDGGFVDDSIFTGGTDNTSTPDPEPFSLEECQTSPLPDAVKDSGVGAFAGDATWANGLWVDWSED